MHLMQRNSLKTCHLTYMKYLFALSLLTSFAACRNNGEPFAVPLIPGHVWVDQATKTDTIITGDGYTLPPINLYYAAKDWQTLGDSSFIHGYRNVRVAKGDSVMVTAPDDMSTNYDGPFYFHVDEANKTLQAQNFLDTTQPNATRVFIQL